MVTLIKVEASYYAQRGTWRLHVRYIAPGESTQKRTYLALGLTDERKDAKEAKARALAFQRGLDVLWIEWTAQFRPKGENSTDAAPAPVAKPAGDDTLLDWLLVTCLKHDEIWGQVACPANYRSTVRTLQMIAGDWPVSDFEPAAGGRAKVMSIVETLRARGLADGTVRKLIGALKQALRACVGDGVSAPILASKTGKPLLSDVPAFPRIAKGKPRTKVIDNNEERTIFEILAGKESTALAEETAFAAKVATATTEARRIRMLRGWDRSSRFTSQQWRWYRRLVAFLIETGMRRGEALYCGPHAITTIDVVDDEDDVTDTVTVLHLPEIVTKTYTARDVNISQAVADMIEDMTAEARPMSLTYKTQPMHVAEAWFPLTEDQCCNMWIAVRKEASKRGVDLTKVVLHTLRHTNATRLRRKAMPIDELARHLGHSNISTTLETYEHVGNQKTAMSSRFFTGKRIGAKIVQVDFRNGGSAVVQ